MKIRIEKISNDKIVEFSCDIGMGFGVCNDNQIRTGEEYYVEFDIYEIPEMGNNVKIVSDEHTYIKGFDTINDIQGLVEFVDEDGLFYFRLNFDCLIMVSSPNVRFNEGDQILFRVDINKFKIFPIGAKAN